MDVNANGRIDLEDSAGIAGVKVTRRARRGSSRRPRTRPATYSFSHLPAGTYTVTQTQPGGYKTSTPNLATATIGSTPATVNFGEAKAVDLAVSLSARPGRW